MNIEHWLKVVFQFKSMGVELELGPKIPIMLFFCTKSSSVNSANRLMTIDNQGVWNRREIQLTQPYHMIMQIMHALQTGTPFV